MLNTEYRLYDPRLAQWLTRDPVFQPWESPYSAMASNPILFSDPQGDTPGTDGANGHTMDLDPSESGGSAGTNKDNVVRFGGSSNRKVEETTQKLEKNTNQKPTIGIPLGIEIATTKDVRFVYEGKSILGIQMYNIVTNDGIVATLGILLPSTDTKPTYIVHTESEKGAEVMSNFAQSMQNSGHHVVSSGEFAAAAGGGNGTNPSKPIFDSEIRTFVPKTSAKKASPAPAAKQKTDQSAGSETLDDALRGSEQPFGGGIPRSFDDIVANPKSLWGKSSDEVGSILGEGWTMGTYGSKGTGWKFIKGDLSIFYHPGGGRHVGSYYGFSSGKVGKNKIVGSDYKPLPGDKAKIININN